MSEYEHVPRLDEGSDELMGQLLRAARRDVPGEQRMNALSLALLDKMGPGAPDGSDGAGGGDTGGGEGTGGAEPGGGAEGLGGSTGAEAARTGAELAQGAQAATGAGASVAPATAAVGAGGSVAAKATLGTLAALVVAGGVYTATRSTPTAPPPQTATTASVAAPAAVAPKAMSTTGPAPVVSIDDLPKLEEPPKAASGATPAPLADTAAEPKKKKKAADAMADLRRAQDALGSSPARALRLIARHRSDYPRSAFSQERDVLEIDALIRLGRRSEAVAKGDQFAKYYPKSGHRRRIDALLGR